MAEGREAHRLARGDEEHDGARWLERAHKG